MPKKIVFCAPHTNISGGTKVIFTLADLLSDQFEVVVSCRHVFDPKIRWLFEKRPPKFRLAHPSEYATFKDAAVVIDYMDGNIDIRKGIPHILFMQGYGSVQQEYLNLGLPFKKVIATSSWLAKLATVRDHKNVVVIPPGLSDEFINHGEKLFNSKGPKKIGSLFHRSPLKNSRALVVQFERSDKKAGLELVMLSAYPPDAAFKVKLPCDWKINQYCSQLVPVYDSCSVWVSPSLREGLGLTTLEAMACGLPTVWVRSGGLDDYMVDGENCLIVEQNQVMQLGAVVERLLDDSDLALKLSRGGQRTARQFTWERCLSSFKAVLAELV